MLDKASRAVAKARAVAALGLITENITRMDVDTIFSAVTNDRVVNKRALALGFEKGTCIMVADHQDYAEIIEHMSPDEKAALRKRIGR